MRIVDKATDKVHEELWRSYGFRGIIVGAIALGAIYFYIWRSQIHPDASTLRQQAIEDYKRGDYVTACTTLFDAKKENAADGWTRYYLALCQERFQQPQLAKKNLEWIVNAKDVDPAISILAKPVLDRVSRFASTDHSKILLFLPRDEELKPGERFTKDWEIMKKKYKNRFDFQEIDAEEDLGRQLAGTYQISQAPSVILVNNEGDLLKEFTGKDMVLQIETELTSQQMPQ